MSVYYNLAVDAKHYNGGQTVPLDVNAPAKYAAAFGQFKQDLPVWLAQNAQGGTASIFSELPNMCMLLMELDSDATANRLGTMPGVWWISPYLDSK